MRSIRAHLVIGLVAGFGVLLAAGSVALYFSIRGVLLAEFDAGLEARAQALATLTKTTGTDIELEFAEENMPEFDGHARRAYFEVWRPDGRVLERSPSLRDADLPRPAPAAAATAFWDLDLPDGLLGRAIAVSFAPQLDDDASVPSGPADARPQALVVVALDRARLDRQLRMFTAATAGVAILMMAGAVVLALVIIHQALQPLTELARGVSGIDAGALSTRFSSKGMPAELEPICSRLNELLSRLQSAFDRERHFSANAAHELRTPVAELRSLAEVALKWPDGNAETQQAFADALAIAEQMEGIVSGLLMIARRENGDVTVTHEAIALETLVPEAWQPFAAQATHKHLSVRINIPSATTVEADRALLRIMLVNFLSNAAEYTPEGGEVSISADQEEERTVLKIANDTSDLTPADLPHLFDRFWRKSTARTSSHRAGLGLSVSRAIADIIGAPLSAGISTPGHFVITLTLPAVVPIAPTNVATAPQPASLKLAETNEASSDLFAG